MARMTRGCYMLRISVDQSGFQTAPFSNWDKTVDVQSA
jgi:hypothetical protein